MISASIVSNASFLFCFLFLGLGTLPDVQSVGSGSRLNDDNRKQILETLLVLLLVLVTSPSVPCPSCSLVFRTERGLKVHWLLGEGSIGSCGEKKKNK